ncbi:putative membrane protein [Rhizobium leguminosarum]
MSIINTREARRARERRAAVESLATVGLGLIRAQPLLTAGVLAAIVAANLVGSKRDD